MNTAGVGIQARGVLIVGTVIAPRTRETAAVSARAALNKLNAVTVQHFGRARRVCTRKYATLTIFTRVTVVCVRS